MRNITQGLWGAVLCGLAACGYQSPANAQTALQALVTATCGTPGITYTSGRPGTVTINTSGQLCIVGTFSFTPSGTQNVNLTQLNAVALGSPSAYGTSPGAVNVAGVNAFVTNTVPVTGTFFQATQPVSGTFFQATQPISGNVGIQSTVNVTPIDCSGTITSGTVAQNAFTAAATRHGFTIANIDTSEVLWFSMTTTAAASGAGSFPLAPATATTFAGLSSFTSPVGLGINTALSVVATTTAHKYSCTVY